MTYTRNFLTCFDAGFNGFSDLVLMWIDKMRCYIVYTVMADDGSSFNSPVQLVEHCHFL